jgi:beta-N-acetylhexosaminidase
VRRRSGVAAAALAAAAVAGCGGSGGSNRTGSGTGTAPTHGRAAAAAHGASSLRRQVGQLLILSFHGTTMPGYVGNILRDGTAGGAILFGENVASPGQLRGLTAALQRAGHGSVVVAVDQEGGAVRIVPFAGPDAGQPEIATAAAARAAGRSAARDLRGLGINVNLAPVADVGRPGSGLGGRDYPGGPGAVAALVGGAVRGTAESDVGATAKHFPGFGAADANTDARPVTIGLPASELRAVDLAPFRVAVQAGVPLVMVSHALYPSLDGARIASQSAAIIGGDLRGRLGFRGAVVTDSIEARAVIRRSDVGTAAVRSVAAGADLVLMTGPGSFRPVFRRLLAEARRSVSFRARVSDAAAHVRALKVRLGLRSAN